MKYFTRIHWCLALFFTVFTLAAAPISQAASNKGTVQFVYGNKGPLVPEMKKAWGFSAFIQYEGKNILFNTAGVEEILEHNFEVLGIKAEELDAVVISHHHYEMILGLGFIMKKNPDVPIYTTETVTETITKTHPEWRKNFINIDRHVEFTPNIIFQNLKSGQRRGGPRGIYEVHIVLKTDQGLVLFTGCGHPQLRTIIHKSKSLTKDNRVNFIAGGTRLVRPDNHIFIEDSGESLSLPQLHYYSDEYYQILMKDLKEAGVEYVMPTHCTMEPAETFFKESFEDKFMTHSLGLKVEFPVEQKQEQEKTD